MTREEAKKLLTNMMMSYTPRDLYGDYDDPEPYEQAINMAIKALEELPKRRKEAKRWKRKALKAEPVKHGE